MCLRITPKEHHTGFSRRTGYSIRHALADARGYPYRRGRRGQGVDFWDCTIRASPVLRKLSPTLRVPAGWGVATYLVDVSLERQAINSSIRDER